jgi:hypothetical protein
MPPPPNYDCPVCKKGFQRGYLARHIATHEQKDLIECVINKDKSDEPKWHPSFDCSGHTYFICPTMKDGYEKDTLLHKRHDCNYTYKAWLTNAPTAVVVTEKPKPKEKNVVIETEDQEPINTIDMTLPEDEVIQPTHIQCKCHIEITQLKMELLELQKLRAWRDMILSSVPQDQKVDVKQVAEPKPLLVEVKPKSVVQLPVKVEPKVQVLKTAKPKAENKPKIHASKKEIEKGMWCVECSACKTTAQFASDLRECCNCKKLSHFNDDLTNCYHWDCTVCDKKSCYGCVRAAGGNKVKPLCSPACAAIYKSQRE